MKHFLAILLLSLPSLGQLVGTNVCTASVSGSAPTCVISVGTTGADLAIGNTVMVMVVNGHGGSFTVDDNLGNTYVQQGGTDFEWGGGFPACGGIGAICTSWFYKSVVTVPGAATITFHDTFASIIMAAGQFQGIGSFDVYGIGCAGGNDAPCTGPGVSGNQVAPFTTAASSEWAFSICACNSVGGGCSGVPTPDAAYNSRASISTPGGDTRAVFFDKQLTVSGAQITNCDVGTSPTNYGLWTQSFGFTPQNRVSHRSIWK